MSDNKCTETDSDCINPSLGIWVMGLTIMVAVFLQNFTLVTIPDTRGQFTSLKSSYVGATGDILRLGTFLLLTSSSLVTSQVSQPRVLEEV